MVFLPHASGSCAMCQRGSHCCKPRLSKGMGGVLPDEMVTLREAGYWIPCGWSFTFSPPIETVRRRDSTVLQCYCATALYRSSSIS